MIHAVKILPKYYKEIAKGNKKFEVRKNDRDYQVGDYLALNEWDDERQEYTRRAMLFKITYILDDENYCKDGYVIMSIQRIKGEIYDTM